MRKTGVEFMDEPGDMTLVRTILYRISAEYEGRKLSEYLFNQGYSRKDLTRMRQIEGCMLRNGQAVHMNIRLSHGDEVLVKIYEEKCSTKIPPIELPFPVVYEDEDIIVVDKPANMPIHPSMMHYENSLGNAAAYHAAQKGKPFVYRCVNRLDKNTTGLTILAQHMLSASVLYESMKNREIHREYFAIVEDSGNLSDEGTIDAPIARKDDSAIERCVDFKRGERAITHYKVLKRFENSGKKLAYVSCVLETGRTHQIRVHMKYIGCPLIGDFLYNPDDTTITRQALHAGRLSFPHPITHEILSFEAPLPEDMKALVEIF